MRIIELKAENIKRLKAVEIKPKGDVVVISGKNDQGKSSVLDSIWYALGGRDSLKRTPKPIRDGAEKAQVRLDLGDIIVTRNWTDNEHSYLKVENKEKMEYKSPQRLLDSFVGKLSFDPLEFARLNTKEQREMLLELVDLEINLDELEERKRAIYEERTLKNRELKSEQAQLEAIEEPMSVPNKEVSIIALSEKLTRGMEHNTDMENHLHNLGFIDGEIEKAIRKVEELTKTIEENKEKKELCETWLKENKRINIDSIRAEISQAEAVNERIRSARAFQKKQKEVNGLSEECEELNVKIGEIDLSKKKALDEADMPIKGLSINEEGVIYNGIPFSQLSDSEQLKVSMAIAMTINPKLRVIRIRDGSLLDKGNMEIIRQMATKSDFQVWIERVEEGEIGFIIEDGGIRKRR